MTANPSSSDPHVAAPRLVRGVNVLATAAALAAATSAVVTPFFDGDVSWASSPGCCAAVAGTFAFGVVASLATRWLSPLWSKLASAAAMSLAVATTAFFARPGPLDLFTAVVAPVVSVPVWGTGLVLVWFAFGRPLDAARKAAMAPASLSGSDSAERRVARVAGIYGAISLWLALLENLVWRGPITRHGPTVVCALVAIGASALASVLLSRRRARRLSFLARVRAGAERDYRVSRDGRGREILTRLHRLPAGMVGSGYRVADLAEAAIGLVDASEDAGSARRAGHSS